MRKILGYALSLAAIVLGLLLTDTPKTAKAEYAMELKGGMISDNSGDQNYGKYGAIIKSYLIMNDDGTYTRVEFVEGQILVETYSAEGKLIDTMFLNMELPIFGGFYEGKDYYFIVFGQNNLNEDDTIETYRIVKYDKNFNRLGAASHMANNTYIPMRASSLRMLEYDGCLYIRTARQMYKTSDGYNHQANITICVKISSMTVKDSQDKITYGLFGYTSHSFSQFLAADGDKMIAVDHGDNYPRAIRLCKSDKAITAGKIPASYTYNDVLKIQGDGGNNYTGASLGGLEVSESSYLVAGNSILQDEGYLSHTARNVFVGFTPRDSVTDGAGSTIWLTDYAEGQGSATTPQMVKLDKDRFMILWQVMQPETDPAASGYMLTKQVNYCIMNGNGSKISKVMSIYGNLSDCQPMYKDGSVIWYASDGQRVLLYIICADGKAEKVNLTFDTLGGSPIESQELSCGAKGKKPTEPTLSGYEFDGWTASDENGEMKDFNFKSPVLKDTTLYARWKRTLQRKHKGGGEASQEEQKQLKKNMSTDTIAAIK